MSLLKRALTRVGILQHPYQPYISESVDQELLLRQIATFFGQPLYRVRAQYQTYTSLHEARSYSEQLGERKTLCFEEAFLLYVILNQFHPQTIVEIGTQYGKSTRRIIDMAQVLSLHSRIVCFDIEDQVNFFAPHEAQLIIKDVTRSFCQDVLQTYNPGLIYLDAHPYALLKQVITDVLDAAPDCVLAIHDCSRYLCNPKMTLAKDDPHITSATGHWERHVLGEVFGVSNPLSKRLDDLQTLTHKLRIFGTPHGLSVIAPHK